VSNEMIERIFKLEDRTQENIQIVRSAELASKLLEPFSYGGKEWMINKIDMFPDGRIVYALGRVIKDDAP